MTLTDIKEDLRRQRKRQGKDQSFSETNAFDSRNEKEAKLMPNNFSENVSLKERKPRKILL